MYTYTIQKVHFGVWIGQYRVTRYNARRDPEIIAYCLSIGEADQEIEQDKMLVELCGF